MWPNNINMVLGGPRPWTIHTWSEHEVGRTMYVAAFNLWPASLLDPSVTLADLRLGDNYVLYDWRARKAERAREKIFFGLMKPNKGYYYILSPLLDSGLAVIGEPDKFVTLSRQRFPRVWQEGRRVKMEVVGVPGEKITVAVFAEHEPVCIEGCGPAAFVSSAPQLYTVELEPGAGQVIAIE